MNATQSLMEIPFAEIAPIADRFDEDELQSWAMKRVNYLLSTEPDSCISELGQIAVWVRNNHSGWMEKDDYWVEFVRINTGVARSGRWLTLFGL